MNHLPNAHTMQPSGDIVPADCCKGINLDALLHQYIRQIQGGRLYPDRIPINTMECVLDVGCGTGEWIFDLSQRYPKLHIFGVDANEDALQQAKLHRNSNGLRQIELRHMDLMHGIPIPDHRVDFVHMRRFARFVRPRSWTDILQECRRVLRPDGWLAVVEMELCEVSSPACMTIHRSTLQARAQLGRSLDSSGMTLGVAPRLYKMMIEASFDEVSYDLHTVDLGFMAGPTARLFLADMIQNAFVTKPLVVQQGILDGNEFDQLVEQARIELQSPDLCGWALLISAYGRCGG